MSRMTDSLRAVNSALRTLLALVLVGFVGVAGWYGYTAYVEPGRRLDEAQADLAEARRLIEERDEAIEKQSQQIALLRQDLEEKKRLIAQLETSLRLLKVDHRIAELRVLEQRDDPDTGRVLSTVEFVEINDEGAPIDDPRRFTIEGDLVYIEANVVQFQDKFVEQADPDRATSLCLFQRMYGEYQEPHEGFALDEVGSRPTAYARGGEMTEFEEKIWQDFWEIANSPELAATLGVRAIQKEAPAMKVRPGHTYRVMLRASGGLTIQLLNQSRPAAASRPDA
jgi:hypothetical protein